jgi:hypothetical protein
MIYANNGRLNSISLLISIPPTEGCSIFSKINKYIKRGNFSLIILMLAESASSVNNQVTSEIFTSNKI